MDWKQASGAACAAAALASLPSAQFDNQWVSFTKDNSHLSVPPLSISDKTTSLPGDTPGSQLIGIETDVAWDDLDKDGWVDLVIVRKQPWTSAGKRTNMLFMNVEGVLTDKTAQYATASDVPGDQGFLTPTNDRDIVIGDLNGDTWLDLVTATTLSDNDPKHISHPRVYMNLGRDAAGNWLGFRHEDARIPQLFSFTSGAAQAPRFCSIGIGDLTNDGAPDLYFGDYDSSGAGGVGEPFGGDLNDRLFINDGNGYFTDESAVSYGRMSSDMLKSAFGMATVIDDFNGDGYNDVLKDTALVPPQDIRVIYNNAANPGFFQIQDKFHTGFAPYHVNSGDLNQDGRLDIVISDDASDRWRVNLGNDAFGRVIWSSAKAYNFLVGGDDGFGSNNLIADLDQDGWGDALHCDIDVDIPGGTRRLHIYHNLGGTPGGQDMIMREERQSTSSSGWIGVVGLTTSTLQNAHDVAVFDVDNDLDPDMVLSRFAGTDVYTNDGGVVCQKSVGFGGPGFSQMSVCGGDLSVVGQSADVKLSGAPASAPSIWAISDQMNVIPLNGGFLVAFPPLVMGGFTTSATGQINLPSALTGNGSGNTLYIQAATLDFGLPTLWSISNAVEIQL